MGMIASVFYLGTSTFSKSRTYACDFVTSLGDTSVTTLSLKQNQRLEYTCAMHV